MTGMELNFGLILKSSMRKARAHKGRRYSFGGLITEMCLRVGVPTDSFGYCPHIEASPCIVSAVQGLEPGAPPTLTIVERACRDELVMACMFEMQSLMLRDHGRLITPEEIANVEIQYPLNDHARAMLGIGPQFIEQLDDDISSDLEANKSDTEEEDEEEVDDTSKEED